MGYLIALDGIDASGKTTQAEILERKLRGLGYDVLYLSFPEYDCGSSALARLYLNGSLGEDPNSVNAYAASSFFAADRYISYMTRWKEFYGRGNSVVLANRYTTANAVHQLAKLEKREWDGFLDWLYDYEFGKLKIPEPDLTVLLDMHIDVAVRLIAERGRQKDIHEADGEYLRKCYEAGKYACRYLNWERLVCFEDEAGALSPKSAEEISDSLFGMVKAKLCLQKNSSRSELRIRLK